MIEKEFKLFTNCLAVKGTNTGIIVDTQRGAYYILPNQIIDLLNEYSGQKIYNIFKDFKNHRNILKKYLRYFVINELVIITENSNQFPEISNNFERPFNIDTITLNIDTLTSSIKKFIATQMDILGVSCLKLILNNFDLKETIDILNLVEKSKIKTIFLFTKYESAVEKELFKIESKFTRISKIIFYAIDKGSIIFKPKSNIIHYDTKSLVEILSMRVQNQNNFVLTLEAFNESLLYNTTYNRSVYINNIGDIKRHFEDIISFGNISNANLDEIVTKSEFKEFWAISKDKIKVCKDCEFRYVCPDGSIPYKEKETDLLYTKETKCNYDPYKSKWLNF